MNIESELDDTILYLENGYFTKDGYLFYQPVSVSGKEEPASVCICSAISIVARTRNTQGRQHGRLLEFKDLDGKPKVVPIACSSLQTDGAEVRQHLADLGVNVMPQRKARDALNQFILMSKPEKTALCVDKLGWHNNFSSYILPDKTIGTVGEERIVYQTDIPGFHSSLKGSGLFEEWQKLSKLCEGNSRLVMALCAAFAAPLFDLTGNESGGFNFFGRSSSGKTTTLYVAVSVYGSPDYLNRWRATSNGLEALATTHNNALLVLDELAQVSPKEAGEIAYLLSNGSGKARASVKGSSRPISRWNLLFLSAGEVTLAQHMQEGGKKPKAGQEVRMVDIPADAGLNMGMFEELHGIESPAKFSEVIKDKAAQSYGFAIIRFITELTDHISNDKIGLLETIRALTQEFIDQSVPAYADGQVRRVAKRFALLAVAGELATNAGITGWKEGSATAGVKSCFLAWLQERGGLGPREETRILEQVRLFFQKHGQSRFSRVNQDNEEEKTTVHNRAGHYVKHNGEHVFLVFTEVFKTEISEGFNSTQVAQECFKAGYLLTLNDGKFSKPVRAPGSDKKSRFYVFKTTVLGEGEDVQS